MVAVELFPARNLLCFMASAGLFFSFLLRIILIGVQYFYAAEGKGYVITDYIFF